MTVQLTMLSPYATNTTTDIHGDVFSTGYNTVYEATNVGTVAAPIYPGASNVIATNVITNYFFNGLSNKLTVDHNGDVFGVAYYGGRLLGTSYYEADNNASLFEIQNCGTPDLPDYGSPTILANFGAATYGTPDGGLTLDAHGNLFGTTQNGGTAFEGSIFEIKNLGSVYSPYYSNTITPIYDAYDKTIYPGYLTATPEVISGTTGGQVTTGEALIVPFKGVTIGDANPGATDTMAITVEGAGGTLTDRSGYLMSGGPGTNLYMLQGSAPSITSELDALVFTPYAAGTSTLTLKDVSSAGGKPAIDSTTTVTDEPGVLTGRPPPMVHANDLALGGDVTGPYNLIDMLNLVASYGDLVNVIGTNQQAAQNWYNTRELIENRVETFDGLDYVASYPDLINAFKSAGSEHAVLDAGATHYIDYGHNEGRSTTFNGLDYIASYGELIKAFGANGDAGAYHYIEFGHSEGRATTFDGLDYIASYSDLIKALGTNEQTGAAHYIDYGHSEGRTTTFDGLDYIANYTDLMKAFGANNDAGATHYIDNGFSEHRSTSFNVGAYESAHPDLIGQYASNDAFLTAYINTYKTTGTFLT